jgi:hypothetical protein
MNRLEAPLADDALADHLQRSLRRLEPDALFRRRLRGAVLNRYVATREGLVQAPRRRREMGALGRGVLYASLVLAFSVSAAGTAAAGSLPGDLLYPVKLQLEEVRLRITPPSMQADLLAMALDERLDELEQLAARGQWADVAAAAQGVAEAEERLAVADGDPRQTVVDAIGQHTATLEALVTQAPPSALDGLQQAIQASSASVPSQPSGGSHAAHEPTPAPSEGSPSEDRQRPSSKELEPGS